MCLMFGKDSMDSHGKTKYMYIYKLGERGGLVVNASDTGSRGRGFEPHSGQTVLCP